MALEEIFFPELDVIVKYKKLSAEDAQLFYLDHDGASAEDYRKAVLEHIIFNLKSDVAKRLKELDREDGEAILNQLYNQAVMMNAGLNVTDWHSLARTKATGTAIEPVGKSSRKPSRRSAHKEKIARSKFLNLERHLQERIIGQDEAIGEVVSALKRAYTGLHDPNRPLGVFLFAGASGVGKTLLVRELHKYLYDGKYELARIDCGEYQQKQDNQKLVGSPPGYYGHEEGGQLTNQIIANPDTVVLIDEVEKAHPDILHTFLRVFDEGILTDSQGRAVSFRNTIVIMTTNLGNDKIVDSMTGKRMGFGSPLFVNTNDAELPSRDWIVSNTEEEIRNYFKPELLNRLDKTVVFNHLSLADYSKIAELELQVVQDKLSNQGLSIAWDQDIVDQMVRTGVNPIEGARKLERIRRVYIEDKLADMLMDQNYPKGTIFQVVPQTHGFEIAALAPQKIKAKEATNGSS